MASGGSTLFALLLFAWRPWVVFLDSPWQVVDGEESSLSHGSVVMGFGSWVMGYGLAVKSLASYYLWGSWGGKAAAIRYSIDSFTCKEKKTPLSRSINVQMFCFQIFIASPSFRHCISRRLLPITLQASIKLAICDKSWLVNQTVCFFLLLRLREHALKRNSQGASSTHHS